MKKTLASLLCFFFVLCSCTAHKEPQNTTTPSQTAGTSENESTKINLESINNQVENICSFPRKAGTTAERDAAQYIAGQFRKYGYEPEVNEFTYESKRTQKLPDICQLTILQKETWTPDCYIIKYAANGTANGPIVYYENDETDCKNALALIPWRENLQNLVHSACSKGATGILLFAETEDVEYDPIPWECIDKPIGIPVAGICWADAKKIIKNMKQGVISARLEIEGATWEMTSQNVAAIKKTACDDPGILIIGAHYDSFAGLTGASDDASGVAVMLEAARLLKDIKGDTEIHFVAFGADEEGLAGANHYADSLTDTQKARVTGMIDLERLGSGELSVGYPEDDQSWIGETLRLALAKVQDGIALAEPDDRGGHKPFAEDGMDAVMLFGEDEKDYCKTARDRISSMDDDKLYESAQAVVTTALAVEEPGKKVINDSMKSSYSNSTLELPDGEIKADSLLFLGDDRYEMQKRLGIVGLPYKTDPIPGTFLYKMKWFGMNSAVDSLFHFDEEGYLRDVDIRMQDAGYPYEEALKAMLTSLGKPDDTYKEKNYEEYYWNGIYGKMHMLEKDGDVYRVCVYQSYGEEKILKQFNVNNGQIAFSTKDAKYEKMWDIASSIMLPEYKAAISKFTVFTDGVSGKLAEVEFLDGKKTKYNLGLDYWDIYDEQGNIRDKKSVMETIAHEYGHIITISNEQVDLNEMEQKDVFADIGTYKDGSYLKAFYDAFYSGLEKDAESMDHDEFYAKYIELFPTRYATSSPSEDLAECFAFFATGENDAVPPSKLSFLLKYPELVQARDFALTAMGK